VGFKMRRKYNHIALGILIGLLGPLIILFGVNIYQYEHLSYLTYLKTGFDSGVISPYLKIAALFNLAPFFLFINSNRLKTARGIVFSTIIFGIIIAYLTFK
jgi:hypothetical protein